jgi:hypothetical protein
MAITKDDMVGVYRQIGEDVVNAEGVTTYTDNNRTSQIMYSADGYVGVVSTRNGRARVSNSDGRGDLSAATADERAEAANGITCYAGRFEVKDGIVHHHVEMALNPNLVGHTLLRRITFDGPKLTLTSLPDAQGNVRNIRWQRVDSESAPSIPQVLQSMSRMGRRMLAEFRHDFLR